jgi:uncharacterized protein YhhL (DUF1145 family)
MKHMQHSTVKTENLKKMGGVNRNRKQTSNLERVVLIWFLSGVSMLLLLSREEEATPHKSLSLSLECSVCLFGTFEDEKEKKKQKKKKNSRM